MKREILNVNFLSAVNEKIPNRTKLANQLVDILHIEKEAVYRRLRFEVPFTFSEVALIAQNLNLSLDNIIGIESENNRPLNLILHDYETPTDSDLIMIKNFTSLLEIIKRDRSSTLCESWNILPYPLVYNYENLRRYYIFRWRYQFKSNTPAKKLSEVNISSHILEYQMKHLFEHKNIAYTYWIFDKLMFSNMVKDIKYFQAIRLITFDEMMLLREELLNLLLYIENLAITGYYPDTKNKVSIYISGVNLDSNFTLYETKSYTLSLIRSLIFSACASSDETLFHSISGWLNALKRLSTLISVSGEKQRIEYINEQRSIINSL